MGPLSARRLSPWMQDVQKRTSPGQSDLAVQEHHCLAWELPPSSPSLPPSRIPHDISTINLPLHDPLGALALATLATFALGSYTVAMLEVVGLLELLGTLSRLRRKAANYLGPRSCSLPVLGSWPMSPRAHPYVGPDAPPMFAFLPGFGPWPKPPRADPYVGPDPLHWP